MSFFKKKLKPQEEGDLHIDVNAETLEGKGIMKAVEEKEKESAKIKKEEQLKNNPVSKFFGNIKDTKKNWTKVRASPYASLSLSLKFRKVVIAIILPIIAYTIFNMVRKAPQNGFMGIVTNVISVGVGLYICWMIYRTIPNAKKQIEYYKKYPHLINYCPTDTRETVDSILNKVQENKKKADGEKEKLKIQDKKEGKDDGIVSEKTK
jgi:hypothetical protein